MNLVKNTRTILKYRNNIFSILKRENLLPKKFSLSIFESRRRYRKQNSAGSVCVPDGDKRKRANLRTRSRGTVYKHLWTRIDTRSVLRSHDLIARVVPREEEAVPRRRIRTLRNMGLYKLGVRKFVVPYFTWIIKRKTSFIESQVIWKKKQGKKMSSPRRKIICMKRF